MLRIHTLFFRIRSLQYLAGHYRFGSGSNGMGDFGSGFVSRSDFRGLFRSGFESLSDLITTPLRIQHYFKKFFVKFSFLRSECSYKLIFAIKINLFMSKMVSFYLHFFLSGSCWSGNFGSGFGFYSSGT